VDDIVELADRLGKAIAESEQGRNLRKARDALSQHKDLEQTLRDYQQQMNKIAKLQEVNSPIEVEDKHKLQQLQDKLLASEIFKEFTAAQVEYVDLMRKVNGTLNKHLADTEGTADRE